MPPWSSYFIFLRIILAYQAALLKPDKCNAWQIKQNEFTNIDTENANYNESVSLLPKKKLLKQSIRA